MISTVTSVELPIQWLTPSPPRYTPKERPCAGREPGAGPPR
jgi:hypothetical protein